MRYGDCGRFRGHILILDFKRSWGSLFDVDIGVEVGNWGGKRFALKKIKGSEFFLSP
jgi:hypothetical protein